jgi:hypothetical protein
LQFKNIHARPKKEADDASNDGKLDRAWKCVMIPRTDGHFVAAGLAARLIDLMNLFPQIPGAARDLI